MSGIKFYINKKAPSSFRSEVGRAPFSTTAGPYAEHGMRGTKEYSAWDGIKQRCLNPKCRQYLRYGARGITISDEWRNDFMAFYNHIGPAPGRNYSVDRINGSLGYVPGNVRWATVIQQQRNRSSNKPLTAFGETKLLVEWCEDERRACSEDAFLRRIRKGWPLEKALITPKIKPGHWRGDKRATA